MATKGRPRVKIDLVLAEKLGAIDCTLEEVSAIMDIGVSTLSMREDFLDAYKKGRSKGRMSLRRRMWRHIEDGNVPVCIFMAKNLLGYRDNPEQTTDQDHSLTFTGFDAKAD